MGEGIKKKLQRKQTRSNLYNTTHGTKIKNWLRIGSGGGTW